MNAKKTHCPVGHAFTKENTYTRPGGQRACRICRKASWEKFKEVHYGTAGARV
jgi:hypothetical protein